MVQHWPDPNIPDKHKDGVAYRTTYCGVEVQMQHDSWLRELDQQGTSPGEPCQECADAKG